MKMERAVGRNPDRKSDFKNYLHLLGPCAPNCLHMFRVKHFGSQVYGCVLSDVRDSRDRGEIMREILETAPWGPN